MEESKVIFQFTSDLKEDLEKLKSQLKNLVKAIPLIQAEVAIHGNAVNFFVNENPEGVALVKLFPHRIEVVLCNNALVANNILPQNILEGCKIVPAAIAHIVERQMNGWAYIKA